MSKALTKRVPVFPVRKASRRRCESGGMVNRENHFRAAGRMSSGMLPWSAVVCAGFSPVIRKAYDGMQGWYSGVLPSSCADAGFFYATAPDAKTKEGDTYVQESFDQHELRGQRKRNTEVLAGKQDF